MGFINLKFSKILDKFYIIAYLYHKYFHTIQLFLHRILIYYFRKWWKTKTLILENSDHLVQILIPIMNHLKTNEMLKFTFHKNTRNTCLYKKKNIPKPNIFVSETDFWHTYLLGTSNKYGKYYMFTLVLCCRTTIVYCYILSQYFIDF